jgi:hypothetical protein
MVGFLRWRGSIPCKLENSASSIGHMANVECSESGGLCRMEEGTAKKRVQLLSGVELLWSRGLNCCNWLFCFRRCMDVCVVGHAVNVDKLHPHIIPWYVE